MLDLRPVTGLLALTLFGGGCDACASHDLGDEERRLGALEVGGREIVVTARLRGRRNTEDLLGGRMSGVRVATEGERWRVQTFVAAASDTVELVDMAGMPGWTGAEEDEAERRYEALALEHCAGGDGRRVYRVGGLDDGTWRVVESIERSVLHAAFESEADDCAAAVRDAPSRDALLEGDWHDALRDPNRRGVRACGLYLAMDRLREALLCGLTWPGQSFREEVWERLESGRDPELETVLFDLARPGGLPALGDPALDAGLARTAAAKLPNYLRRVTATPRAVAFVDATLSACATGGDCPRWRVSSAARLALALDDGERCDAFLTHARRSLARGADGAEDASAATLPLRGRCGSDALLGEVLVEALAYPTLPAAARPYPDCNPRYPPAADLLARSERCGSFPRVAASRLARVCPEEAVTWASETVAQWAPGGTPPYHDEVVGAALELLAACAPEQAAERVADRPPLARELERFQRAP